MRSVVTKAPLLNNPLLQLEQLLLLLYVNRSPPPLSLCVLCECISFSIVDQLPRVCNESKMEWSRRCRRFHFKDSKSFLFLL